MLNAPGYWVQSATASPFRVVAGVSVLSWMKRQDRFLARSAVASAKLGDPGVGYRAPSARFTGRQCTPIGKEAQTLSEVGEGGTASIGKSPAQIVIGRQTVSLLAVWAWSWYSPDRQVIAATQVAFVTYILKKRRHGIGHVNTVACNTGAAQCEPL